ncbi:uncharacterized protein I303_102829 [Kwoniella dejecticola CBS 10117]|uniref:Thioredoxin domain-containing protein n=1 Tax=Kwoniella dejecticola CBS 10117 TaxID=1296121 RepID=A0A1A6A9U1_9TREE|nr:uncharacterized protein I303_02843 [Kwoniella dejecticola CBS 10117]OBR86827.1 hypothetical protein I303_02843 [Kwoniella dejecticola CBS 10117]
MNPLRSVASSASSSLRANIRPRVLATPTTLARAGPSASRIVFQRGFADSPKSQPGQEQPQSQSPLQPDIERQRRLRDQANVGPFTWKAATLFIATGIGLYFYFESEKKAVLEKRQAELASKSIGKPQIGGPFKLNRHDGGEFTEKDLLGNWTLIYFGFTHCPDICPEELDKMGDAIEIIDKKAVTIGSGDGNSNKNGVLPLFISVDPARDTLPQLKKYIKEFHPRMIGLVGDYEAVKKTCKMYRVYFSTPPDATATDDYLVDHSIFFYLMDPLGQFVDAFGKATTADQVAEKVLDSMKKWEAAGGNAAAGV